VLKDARDSNARKVCCCYHLPSIGMKIFENFYLEFYAYKYSNLILSCLVWSDTISKGVVILLYPGVVITFVHSATFVSIKGKSLNIHMKEATHGNMTSMHFYGWKQGLKTGMYYLRTRPAADAIKFTVDTGVLNTVTKPIKSENVKVEVSGKPVKDVVKSGGMVGVQKMEKAPMDKKSLIEKVVGMSLEDQVLACSIENPGACDMCSG
jgi:hypothetical protein